MLRLQDSGSATSQAIGPKARRLAAALRLGLPIPDGIMLLPEEPLDSGALRSALMALSAGSLPPANDSSLGLAEGLGPPPALPRFAVRSSAMYEDLPGASAAGLFLTRTNVALEDVEAAIAAVRASGESLLVRTYCGVPVAVTVLIQPMVAADKLGVIYLDSSANAVCEERPADTPEWATVTTHALAADDPSPLAVGARTLAALMQEEFSQAEPVASFVEYAVLSDGTVQFLQVRPAPATPASAASAHELWTQAADPELVFNQDQEHNPDPLSLAQAALVAGVADLTPGLRQRVIHGYLYYAEVPGATPPLQPIERLAERYSNEILPACTALLQPLEQYLLAADGALDPVYQADPTRIRLSLAEAWQAYRAVYRHYVTELSPALRRARQHLDQLLRSNLGEPLSQHGDLLAGAAATSVARLQMLWDLAQPGARDGDVRRYLARYGAFAACWDVATPCDDERPERVRDMATALADQAAPNQQLAESEDRYHAAFAALLDRLPRMARGAFKRLLPLARTAQGIAEDDDALFFRAQRLLRWALLRRGALLVGRGLLDHIDEIFELPWTASALSLAEGDTAEEIEVEQLAGRDGSELRRLAATGRKERLHARSMVPPVRLSRGQPLWTPPRTVVLRGYGVPGPTGLVRGRAHVIRDLFSAEPTLPRAGEPGGGESVAGHALSEPPLPGGSSTLDDVILVVPALLPSWAAALWRARALVADSGGLFSHGAILARERGLPAVVGTRQATRLINEGQEIWVDAERGHVYLMPGTTSR
ncbi:MAG TPA: PEP-utilizing enzyme [Pseudomonadota bacterium]|nr:PEP-utilizing enzyme [Pseudomonadota bacterium]